MEEKEFRVRSVYGHRELKTMARVLRKTMRRNLNILLRVFGWAIVALYALIQGMLFAFLGEFSPGRGSILPELAIGVLILALLFEDDLSAWAATWNLLPGTREAETRFRPEEYVVTTQAAETHWHYKQIQLICETKEHFLFFLSRRHVQLYPKTGLEGGTAEEFRAFLTDRTGLPVKFVR